MGAGEKVISKRFSKPSNPIGEATGGDESTAMTGLGRLSFPENAFYLILMRQNEIENKRLNFYYSTLSKEEAMGAYRTDIKMAFSRTAKQTNTHTHNNINKSAKI